MLEYSLVAGLTASGADVYLLHVAITPSVSYVVRTEGFNCGITVSASYSPFCDSDVRVVSEKGEKLEKSAILEVEKYLDGEIGEIPLARREHIGRTVGSTAGWDHYIRYLISIAARSFKSMKVTLDCSNRSISVVVKSVSNALSAETYVTNNEPNGLSISTDYGSTHIEHFQKFVADERYGTGFAYDSGADRCIAVDKNGHAVDGGSVMCICGRYIEEQGGLFNGTVVTTIMPNLGLYKAFSREGIAYMKAAVGDGYMHKNMVTTGHCLGGEQSGHIIFSRHTTTGDGILTSLKVTEVVLEKKWPLGKLASEAGIYPQVFKNARVEDEKTAQDNETAQAEVARVTKGLGSDGRVPLHRSGIEPVIRVTVGAPDIQTYETYVDQVIRVMKSRRHCTQGRMRGTVSNSLKMKEIILEYIL